MATITELKETIVDLQVENAQLQVNDNCPFAFFKISENPNCGCDANISCGQCKFNFWEQYRKDKITEIEKL